MNRITKFFNGLIEGYKKNQQIKEDFDVAKLAIKTLGENKASLDFAADSTVGMYLHADFSEKQKNVLLRLSMDKDNAALFNTVLEHLAQGDPNYMLVEVFDADSDADFKGFSLYRESSLLYAAIVNNKPKVALSLAQNPKANIKDSGYSCNGVFCSESLSVIGFYEETKMDNDPCWFLARKNKMDDVLSVLAEREIELSRMELQKDTKLVVG